MSRALGLLRVGKRREASHSKETASAVSLHLAHGNSSRSGVLRLEQGVITQLCAFGSARLSRMGFAGPSRRNSMSNAG